MTYSQSTGILYDAEGNILGVGYSGAPAGKNNPLMQNVPDIGPLPQGTYTVGPAHTDPHTGPMSMWLEPSPDNEMFGRGGFLMHGDNPAHPGDSSEGCIVMPMDVRQRVAAVGADKTLVVVA